MLNLLIQMFFYDLSQFVVCWAMGCVLRARTTAEKMFFLMYIKMLKLLSLFLNSNDTLRATSQF